MTNEQKIKKPVWQKWWFWTAAVVILAAMANQGKHETPTPKSASNQKTETLPAVPQTPLPGDQRELIRIVNDCITEYQAQPNELKKSVVRTKRGEMLKKALSSSYQVTDWIGTIKEMETTGDGNAILVLQISDSPATIGTTNNELSDLIDKTLIPQNSELFKTIAELSVGDKVSFSGRFASSAEKDFISENSLTEQGSMEEPAFMFHFTKIKKL